MMKNEGTRTLEGVYVHFRAKLSGKELLTKAFIVKGGL
jgi:hypothetical protein